MRPPLRRLPGLYAVAKLPPGTAVSLSGPFASLTRTDGELSLVCEATRVPDGALAVEHGFCCMMVEGPLDFSLVGILSELCAALAAGGISVFTVSTFDTDYVLLKDTRYADAARLLAAAGYRLR